MNTKPTLLVKLDPGAKPIQQPKTGDVGFDLHISETTVIPAHGFADVPSGVHMGLPEGWWGMLTGRSSTIRKRGLLVVQGIIDTGYTGELFSAVWNLTNHDITVEKGDRIAQLILLPNIANEVDITHVNQLPETERGNKGFGSTGN